MDDFEGKTILILGCGYLGMRLVGSAVSRGMRVKAVSRNLDTLQQARDLGAEVFQGMVDESAWHGFAGAEIDFVVNCVSSAGGGLAGYKQSYVEGNESLVSWAGEAGFAGVSVYTSSVSVYPDFGGDWVDEGFAGEPGNERGALIRESEEVFLRGMGAGGAFVLRLAGLYGPSRHLTLNAVAAGPEILPGWGDYHLNLVRIEDVASAVFCCLASSDLASGVYNVVDDEPSEKETIVAWLARCLGVAMPGFSGEAPIAGRSSRRFGEGGRPADRRVSNALLKRRTAWRPGFPSFREGFEDLVGRP